MAQARPPPTESPYVFRRSGSAADGVRSGPGVGDGLGAVEVDGVDEGETAGAVVCAALVGPAEADGLPQPAANASSTSARGAKTTRNDGRYSQPEEVEKDSL
jgi:hypothetical protein